ncbi:hypothetical protein GCM10023205_40540 [Yinghuangia aomiensis]|uniref:Uncharacterized protein n=1 Tax=Yinghuangia aomiensis TaxID=676205 RepID=A0ABP9HGY5_9ACTN
MTGVSTAESKVVASLVAMVAAAPAREREAILRGLGQPRRKPAKRAPANAPLPASESGVGSVTSTIEWV